MNLDTLIASSLARPHRNLYGDLGPRCPTCSGLGSYLVLGGGHLGVTRNTSRCRCEGSGLDLEGIERLDRDQLWQQIHAIESRLGLSLTSRYRFPNLQMSRQAWMECIHCLIVDGTAVANTTSETILVPNVTIPAGYMENARLIRATVAGKWSTTTGTVTHVYRSRWNGVGGTLLAASGTVTLLVSITNAYFEIQISVVGRSNGSAGSLLADGIAAVFAGTAPTIGSATGAPAVAPLTAGGQTAPAAVGSLDLTADTPFSITVQHGAANASNTITAMHYTIESMN